MTAHLSTHRARADNSERTGQVKPPVSVVIRCCLLDNEYFVKTVPHMIEQACFPFSERVLVVDTRTEFEGKYAKREVPSHESFAANVEHLLETGHVDRVVEVDHDPDTVRYHLSRYFGDNWHEVSMYGNTGGPVYGTLFALDSAQQDHVLQMECDLLFYSNGDSWVQRSLDIMDQDDSLWIMMTHPGPPDGGVGESLRGDHVANARWDPGLRIWRFHHATSRYFLIDRRCILDRLSVLTDKYGNNLSFEKTLSHALNAYGAERGVVGDLSSWHLHAHSHDSPFPEWLDALLEAVKRGTYPEFQAGDYDLRLDRKHCRDAWEPFVAKTGTCGGSEHEAPVS